MSPYKLQIINSGETLDVDWGHALVRYLPDIIAQAGPVPNEVSQVTDDIIVRLVQAADFEVSWV